MAAGGADSQKREAALANLCQTYWRPIYGHIRGRGYGPQDAQELTQEFFLQLLEKKFLEGLDREKAKFRCWLLDALGKFLANEWDWANRKKRGGGRQILSLDAEDTEQRLLIEPVDDCTPSQIFDRRWALAVLEQVINRLQAEQAAEGKAAQFRELRDLLGGERDGVRYADVAARLQTSAGALRTAVHRLRKRYRKILIEEIAGTVSSPEEIEEEIRHLFLSLS